jgi:hypothetical protein
VGVNQLVASSGGGSGATSADSAAGAGTGAGTGAEKEHAGASDSLTAGVGPAQRRAFAAARAPRVRAEAFAVDAARVRDRSRTRRALPGTTSLLMDEGRAVRSCAPAGAGAGRRLPVLYEGVPAVLVLRPPSDGRQTVDLYACLGAVPQRSADLPAR